MKQIIVTTLLLLSVFAFGNVEKTAKMTSLKGKIYDRHDNLAGVKVTIDNSETVVYTDFDGNFTINNVSLGVHSIQISSVAYENKIITLDLSKQNNLEIKLYSK